MAKVKGGLGRGLDSLLANGADNSSGDRLTAVAVKDILAAIRRASKSMTKPCRNWQIRLRRKA